MMYAVILRRLQNYFCYPRNPLQHLLYAISQGSVSFVLAIQSLPRPLMSATRKFHAYRAFSLVIQVFLYQRLESLLVGTHLYPAVIHVPFRSF